MNLITSWSLEHVVGKLVMNGPENVTFSALMKKKSLLDDLSTKSRRLIAKRLLLIFYIVLSTNVQFFRD